VYRANANGSTLRPGSSDTNHWNSTNNQDTCQPGPYPRPATVVDPFQVNVGINNAWRATLPNSAWIGAYVDAYNLNNQGSCAYPAMSNQLDDATFRKGAIWVFRLTNGFNVDTCVDPASIRLNLNLSADDEVMVLVNGVTVADVGNFRHYGQWPSTPVNYTTSPSSAFRTGNNSLEIRVKSGWEYTGLLVNSVSVAAAPCSPITPGNVFGSWGEYGVGATGQITGFGSGSAFSGLSTSSTSQCAYSLMTFANTENTAACVNTTKLGNYANTNMIPDVKTYFPVPAGAADAGPNSISDQSFRGVHGASGDFTLNGGTINAGRWLVINAPESTITIAGDINYQDTDLQRIENIPQLVIIAKHINIQGNVRNIDAWLVATADEAGEGTINTCSDVALNQPLSTSICSNELRVNGPVIAQKLYLRRTAGAGQLAAAGTPAEVFNLRPDAYLWGMSQAAGSGRLETVYSRELPPRF
jgi:hypothetical protein